MLEQVNVTAEKGKKVVIDKANKISFSLTLRCA